jgi:hypothetical protein
MLTLYNRDGRAVAYLDDDGKSIYLYSGEPVAHLSGGVYAYSGRFLGWFQKGWILDREGRRVFFTEDASGGPARPVRQVRPVRGVRVVRPVKRVREVRPVKPIASSYWSPQSDESFFDS